MYSDLGSQKEEMDPLELQMVVSSRVCVLGIKLKSSAKSVSALNSRATSPVPSQTILTSLYGEHSRSSLLAILKHTIVFNCTL